MKTKFKNQTNFNRAKHDTKNLYTPVAFVSVSDERLSATELGILVHLLSHADTFIINKNAVLNWSKLGEITFDNAWKNLINYGYIVGKRIQGGYHWTINEISNNSTILVSTGSGFTGSGFTGNENRVLTNIEYKQELNKNYNEYKENSFILENKDNDFTIVDMTKDINILKDLFTQFDSKYLGNGWSNDEKLTLFKAGLSKYVNTFKNSDKFKYKPIDIDNVYFQAGFKDEVEKINNTQLVNK